MKQRRLFFALSLFAILLIILMTAPRQANGRYQFTMGSAGTAAAIPACAGIQAGATLPAMDMGAMPLPTSAASAAATMSMDMGTMPLPMPTSAAMTMSATAEPMSLRITSPADGDTIKGGHIDIQLAVTGLTIDQSHHLHVYLDGQIATMGYTTTIALNNVPPGIHDICVVVASGQHVDTWLEDGIQVVVEAAAATQKP